MVGHMISKTANLGEKSIFFEWIKMKQKFMNLNHETAMRLWVKSFGKETKVKDFTGRIIAKGAYNDRNSEFGWNVDHILPQSRGGKTADHNLVCCHIHTNDEKGNKFPAFVANKKKFTIVKVENHYEIKPEKKSPKKTVRSHNQEEPNLYDSAAGLRLYNNFKMSQNNEYFVGTIKIKLEGITGIDTVLTDFIKEIFKDEDVQFTSSYSSTIRMIIKNYDTPKIWDVNNLLDKCILLNTYLSYYFKPTGVINDYIIFYRLDYYDDRKEFYQKDSKLSFVKPYSFFANNCRLYINNLVIQNSSAKENFDGPIGRDSNRFYMYQYIYTKLAKNLEKEVSRK